eukprot:795482-Rhodomonas_salina.1
MMNGQTSKVKGQRSRSLVLRPLVSLSWCPVPLRNQSKSPASLARFALKRSSFAFDSAELSPVLTTPAPPRRYYGECNGRNGHVPSTHVTVHEEGEGGGREGESAAPVGEGSGAESDRSEHLLTVKSEGSLFLKIEGSLLGHTELK